LDYFSWAESQGIKYSPIEHHAITVQDLEAVAAAQSTELRPGDILLVRSGFVRWYNEATEEQRIAGTRNGSAWAGVEGSKESVEWIWDHHFAAVAGDANAFELWPARDERYREFLNFCGISHLTITLAGLHDNLLSLFGTPIGEMFDLERLAETCKVHHRWSFFFTSAPLNFPGGVASPPNGICIL
jgi:kynurenine formamidase